MGAQKKKTKSKTTEVKKQIPQKKVNVKKLKTELKIVRCEQF